MPAGRVGGRCCRSLPSYLPPHRAMKTIPALIAAALIALCFAQHSAAQSVDEIKSQAEAGDADSQGLLSLLILWDEVDLPDEKAVELARDSANAGSSFGSFALGLIYKWGYGGVVKNADEAAARMTSAVPDIRSKAEAGSTWAALLMFGCLSGGLGTDKDVAGALPWLRKAAEQGNAVGQATLAMAYGGGEGVEKDPAEGARWARKAAEQGNAGGQFMLGVAFRNGDGLEEDRAEAAKWLRKAAEQGHASAQALLSWMLFKGQGVGKDPQEAMKLAQKSAEQGNFMGQFYHGVMLGTIAEEKINAGQTVASADINKAIELLTAARDNPQMPEESRAETDSTIAQLVKLKDRLAKPSENNALAQVEQMLQGTADTLNARVDASDPEEGKFGGPSTDTVTKLAALGALADNNGTVKVTLMRGEPLAADRGGSIPAGTKLYPVRAKGGGLTIDYYFYQDPFGEWRVRSDFEGGGLPAVN